MCGACHGVSRNRVTTTIRYKQLLAEAVDETKRLELIDLMIKEGAREGWKPSGRPIAWR